jgi:hypothetical protein
MIDKSDLRAVWDGVVPFVPPMLGAYIGLRYAARQTLRERLVTWVSSAAAGIYLGAGLGEFYGLGTKVTGAVMFLIAMFGSELFAAGIAALRQLAADPVGVFRRVLNTITGRGEA